MEPRELYEPEDIEQLLIERSYDDLLEEERAFVLRHLSGREEYETMRALLLRVHEDDVRSEPLDADPAVRTHLLEVFRAEREPQWRIWLNSVRAFLIPAGGFSLWRPALAFGSVALVVFLVVLGSRRLEEVRTTGLAEVPRKEKAALEKARTGTELEVPAVVGADTRKISTDNLDADAQASAGSTPGVVEEAPPPAEDALAAKAERSVAAGEATLDAAQADEIADAVMMEPQESVIAAPPAKVMADSDVTLSGTVTHVVTANELVRNYSAAQASDAKVMEELSRVSATRSSQREKGKKALTKGDAAKEEKYADATLIADAGNYLGLLRAAW